MIRWKPGRPLIMPLLKAGRPWQHYCGLGALMGGLYWCGRYFVPEIQHHPDERVPLKIIALIILTIYVWRKNMAPAWHRPRKERIRFL